MIALTTVGFEKELNLMDERGFLQNRADEVLSDPRNPIFEERRRFVYESSLTQVEYNSPPLDNIHDLHSTARRDLVALEEITEDLGLYPVSASEFGAGVSRWRTGNRRYDIYPLIIGDVGNSQLNRISGVHAHFSINSDRALEQFWLLISLDPLSYALTSTSPINHDGKNGLSCHRINQTRYVVFSDFPLHAHLQDYPGSMEDLSARDRDRFEMWQERAVSGGVSSEEFRKYFSPDNTGYLPVRQRPRIGPTGTFEVRAMDTAPLDTTAATIALYKGTQDRVFRENIPVVVSQKDGVYSFGSKRVILPNYNTLLLMERDAIEIGLESDSVVSYLQQVLEFSEKGLSPRDREYLQPVREMLDNRRNPGSAIMGHMRQLGYHGEQFNSQQAASANIFARMLYQDGLARYN